MLSSCQKENDKLKAGLSVKEAENRINLWLEKQVSADNQVKNTRIQLLKEKLDYSILYFEQLRDDEHFIIVPVKEGFPSINNRNKKSITVFLLIENELGIIRKGDIVQYMSEKQSDNTSIPHNSFFKIFNAEPFTENAQFSFLTIADRLEYEVKYVNGALVSSGRVTGKESATTLNGPPQDPISPDCIDWYLVTTYYYEDGSTTQTEEFLYNTCGSSGSGGQGNEIEYEFEALRSVSWNVWSPYGPPASSGTGFGVNSLETIKGRRNSAEPQGGHFKSIFHSATACNTCPQDVGVYVDDNVSVSAVDQQANSAISGHFGVSTVIHISGAKSWQFQDIFP